MGLFSDTIVLPDGRILFIPSDSSFAYLLDQTIRSFTPLTGNFGSTPQKFSRGMLLPDGRVACIPDRLDNLFVFDDRNVEDQTEEGQFFENTPTTDMVQVGNPIPNQTRYTLVPPNWSDVADVLVIGGGGGGDTGGGGGGQFQEHENVSLQRHGSIEIRVGRGGRGTSPAEQGYSSQFGDEYVSIGGGRGGRSIHDAGDGGSGGGGGASGGLKPGGKGLFGNDGGDNRAHGRTPAEHALEGAGGGGAGQRGFDSQLSENSGRGGDGLPSSITGEEIYYSGGGGRSNQPSLGGGSASFGGGGNRGNNGGDGIVIVKLKSSSDSHPPKLLQFHYGVTFFRNVHARPDGFDIVDHPRLYSDAVLLTDGRVMLVPYDIGFLRIWNPVDDTFETLIHDKIDAPDLRGQLLPNGTLLLVSREPGHSIYLWNPQDRNSITKGPVWNVGVEKLGLDDRGFVIAVTSSNPPELLRWAVNSGPIDTLFTRFVS